MKNSFLRLHLKICFVVLGGYAICAQVLFVREFLVVFYGNEFCLGIIFAIWLAGIALGSYLGSWISDRLKHRLRVFLLLQVAMCLLLPIQIYMTRIIGGVFEVPLGEYRSFLSMIYASTVSILPMSSLVGCAFPFACRVLINKEESGASAIGWVYT